MPFQQYLKSMLDSPASHVVSKEKFEEVTGYLKGTCALQTAAIDCTVGKSKNPLSESSRKWRQRHRAEMRFDKLTVVKEGSFHKHESQVSGRIEILLYLSWVQLELSDLQWVVPPAKIERILQEQHSRQARPGAEALYHFVSCGSVRKHLLVQVRDTYFGIPERLCTSFCANCSHCAAHRTKQFRAKQRPQRNYQLFERIQVCIAHSRLARLPAVFRRLI